MKRAMIKHSYIHIRQITGIININNNAAPLRLCVKYFKR